MGLPILFRPFKRKELILKCESGDLVFWLKYIISGKFTTINIFFKFYLLVNFNMVSVTMLPSTSGRMRNSNHVTRKVTYNISNWHTSLLGDSGTHEPHWHSNCRAYDKRTTAIGTMPGRRHPTGKGDSTYHCTLGGTTRRAFSYFDWASKKWEHMSIDTKA